MVQAVSRQKQVQWVLGLTLVLNLIVFAIKLTLGLVTGSLSLIADALHTSTDGASNILGLISVHYADPEPDWDHPYGHLKFEAVGALAIAAFLGVAGIEILRSAIERLLGTESAALSISATSLQFMILVLIINICVTVYEHREGKRLNSRILIADARHTLTDVWVTIVVMAGLWGIQQGWLWVDTALAFPLAGLVFWSAWEVLHENLPVLTDRVAIAPKAIQTVAMTVPGVLNCHEITSRGIVGQTVFVEMHMVVDTTDLVAAHAITEAVEQALIAQYGPVRTTIHLEPQDYIEPLKPELLSPDDR